MNTLTLIFLSLGLAMDCFAVSLAKGIGDGGLSIRRRIYKVMLMAVLFGLFQGGMPLLGYAAGNLFETFFQRYAPWIALTLLAYIGGKMIWEGLHKSQTLDDGDISSGADMSLPTLLLLSVATSIDALATGVIFIPYPDKIFLGSIIIAIGSFLLSLIGWGIGHYAGKRFKLNAELLGGVILIALGLKIWIEGIWF